VKKAIQLFRKDARHLWPWIAITWVLLALFPVQEAIAASVPQGLRVLLFQTSLPVAMFLLVVMAIQQETLIGDRQYWSTRPFTAWHLMAAKALFFIAFLNAPMLLVRAVVLKTAEMPILENLPALAWYPLLFTFAFILPAAALGAVTRGLGQAILATVAGFIVLTTVGALLFRGSRYPDWGTFHWIRIVMTVAVIGAGGAVVLVLQYTRRKTLRCRLLLVSTAALAFATYKMPPVGPAVAIQTALTLERADGVSILFDQARTGQRALEWNWSSTDPARVQVKIPVRIDGLTPGLEPVDEWTRVCVDWAEGGKWCSGWQVRNGNPDLSRQAAWLRAFIDRDVFERLKDTPVRVQGTVALTLLRRTGAVPINSLNFETAVPEAGRCGNLFTPRGPLYREHLTVSTTCKSPLPRAALAAEDKGVFVVGDLGPVYAPVPLAPWLTPWVSTYGAPLAWPVDRAQPTYWLVVKPVAHLRREFDFAGIRLSDYAHFTP
jgi:hypothetical protein